MKRHLKTSVYVLVIVLLVVAAVRLSGMRRTELAEMTRPAPRVHAVYLESVRSGTLSVTRGYQGFIEPVQQAAISFRTTGHLVSTPKDVGDRISGGDVLAGIDDRLLVQAKDALEAELSGAESELDRMDKQLERRRALHEQDLIEQEALDAAQSAYEVARANVKTLDARLAAAVTELDFAVAYAPFDGIVTERHKQKGDLVLPGEPVYRVENPDAGYRVMIRIPQKMAPALVPGAAAEIRQDDEKIKTRIYRIYPATQEGRLALAELRLEDSPFNLPSGGFVKVDLVIQMISGIIVSEKAILEDDAAARIYRVGDDDRVEIVEVRVLGRENGLAAIEGPVSPGDRVVVAEESMLLHLADETTVLSVNQLSEQGSRP